MKFGLITFKKTENIGDDIQSYSAIKFLPHIDYYIEREKLDLFVPSKKEKVVTLMNGWFLHSKKNAFPSPYIYPIYVSTHVSSYKSQGIKTEYFTNDFVKYLNNYGPIGCRDTNTQNILSKYNVDNYLSGCLTLTLDKRNVKEEKKICLVDVDKKIVNKVKDLFGKEYKVITRTHTLDKKINSKLSWDERFKNVESLLDDYQSSKYVITSRLHCALPCLAMGVNVMLIYDENKKYTKDRLSDYAKILNHTSTNEFLDNAAEIIKKGFKNSKEYKKIRNELLNKVPILINEANPSTDNLPEIGNFKNNYVKFKKNYDKLFDTATDNLSKNKNELSEAKFAVEYWKKEFYILLDKYDTLKKEYNDLYNKEK